MPASNTMLPPRSFIGPGIDWSLRSQINTRMEVDINRDLDSENQAALLTAAMDAGLVLDAETKNALLSFDIGLARIFFAGEERRDRSSTQRLDPRFAASAIYSGKDYTLSANAGFDFQPASFSQIEDTGLTADETTQLTVQYDTSLALQLDALTSLTFGTNARLVDFTEGETDLVSSRTLGFNVAWQRKLTETSILLLTGGLRQAAFDNDLETRSQTLDLSANFNHRRTRRHTFDIAAGVSLVRTTEQRIIGKVDDFDISLTGGTGLDYQLRNVTAGIEISQSVDPSSVGGLQSFTRLNGTLAYRINEREQASVSANYARRTPLSGTESTLETLSIGPAYTVNLTPETILTLGYLFRANNDSDDGISSGHRVFMTLNHDLVLLP